jgi:hypothetical protein
MIKAEVLKKGISRAFNGSGFIWEKLEEIL